MKCCEYDPRHACYKTFFSSTMMPLQHKLEFCHHKAFPGYSILGMQGKAGTQIFLTITCSTGVNPLIYSNHYARFKMFIRDAHSSLLNQISFCHFHLPIKAAGFKPSNIGSLVVQLVSRPLP